MSGRRRVYVVTQLSPAAPSAVFELLADGAGWSRWAAPLISRSWWEREGTPPPGGVGAVRRVGRPPLISREEIVEYLPARRHAYRIRSALLPIRDYLATVDLAPVDGGTEIVWQGSFVPLVPGTGALLAGVLKFFIARLARRLARAAAAGPQPGPAATPPATA
ncbi:MULTISPECIES: SRPBCC family protein [Protofrankia]|uniref:Polyketide cyclase/dehydrase n=1 Tax=Candidatus Protofrankia datiscae TaxID=2716812 RepID=F8B1R0_9ACTN|nr:MULTISPECIES: SRPBCC family protein [Protofrankia]AEH08305.1 Polyketide cyclase/dehydrase [Candidatus Protofrankia datiscae]